LCELFELFLESAREFLGEGASAIEKGELAEEVDLLGKLEEVVGSDVDGFVLGEFHGGYNIWLRPS
jgi:hypothetical protein